MVLFGCFAVTVSGCIEAQAVDRQLLVPGIELSSPLAEGSVLDGRGLQIHVSLTRAWSMPVFRTVAQFSLLTGGVSCPSGRNSPGSARQSCWLRRWPP
ncbi:hypothetical protein ARTHRO9AX_220213 [Arthrobacter sp. 9AX]|nr:hypothetical protein ARTHRO9AX_220213 [Arthrobacter sp. 9AX]